MHFDHLKPCNDCPFRRENFISLTPGRVDEVAGNMISSAGKTFTCHKSIYPRKKIAKKDHQHCGGALIFAEKNGIATQMMRIAERLRIYDPARLMSEDNKANRDLVFDTLDEMHEAHAATMKSRRKKR